MKCCIALGRQVACALLVVRHRPDDSAQPKAARIARPVLEPSSCVDSGGQHTEMTYRFCQPRASRNIWAVKGSSWSKRGDPVWPVPKSRKTRDWGYKPVIIAVDSAKDHLRQMLLTEEHGPGYFHIPVERSDAWLEQLTAEQPIYERKGGVSVRKWHLPRGRANEAFDTLVYAYAALCGLKAVRGLNMERAASDLLRVSA